MIRTVGHAWWAATLWPLLIGGPAHAQTTLVVYPNTPGYQSDGKLSGTLNGQAVAFEYQHTYHPESLGQKDFKANCIRFAANGPVNVQLTVNASITTASLRTVGKHLSFTRNGSTFQFTLPGPGNYYLQMPDLNTPGKITYTVFFFFDDLLTYNAYQQTFAAARNVLNNGVVSHPTLDQTGAVQNVLNGHGAIYFPAGTYRTGQLTIGSNTTIYLAPGALLKGTNDYNTNRYLYTNGAHNVQIAGLGVIDANGFTSGNIPTKGHLYDAEAITNLAISDVIARNSNSWMLHLRRCDQVQVDNVKLFSGKDGIDPDGTRDMTVNGAVIQSIDDGFAIKSKFSGRSCERVTMRDCIVFSCASSLKVGTENYYGVVKDITWDNCDAVDADRGCILYTNADQGDAPVSNITWRNIRVFNFPWSAETGGAPFQFHNLSGVSISNVVLENIVATPTQDCSTYGPVSATFRNVIVNGSSSISATGMTFEGVTWPGVTSQSRPVVFIDPSARNQNEYFNGDDVTVAVQHPYGKAISQVELFVDGAPAGICTSPPCQFTLNGLGNGEHVLQAKATDVEEADNTTAPKRIWIRQNAAPAVVSNSLSSSSLIADNITPYSVTLNGSDPDGVADLVDMRILLDDGVFASDHARGNLAWGASDPDIAYYGGQWTFMGEAAGGGRWAWRLNEWGSDTYITPVSCATSINGTQRTVVFTFKVKRAWAPAYNQKLRGFLRDPYGDNTGWILSSANYNVEQSIPGDFDRDGDVDQEDFGVFQTCYSGPGVEQADPACAGARLDEDVDVDQCDFAGFQSCMSGSNTPADASCTEE